MTRYAESTSVPADRSRNEIERTLQRYGAESFAYGWEGQQAVIMFAAHGRRIRFVLPLPDRSDEEFTMTPTGRERTEKAASGVWEQACRQSWRALALVVKAKLEAVEARITTFENEFLAHTVLPSGQTVGDWVAPSIDNAYLTGKMPPMLTLGA